MMLPSGNDAATALAENFGCLLYFESIGQSNLFEEINSVDITEDRYIDDYMRLFLQEMNKLAQEYELKTTKFSNCHGLNNPLNFSSSLDMAQLTFIALQRDHF
jgi:D-alanyl-D-alanine carboxypeptidase